MESCISRLHHNDSNQHQGAHTVRALSPVGQMNMLIVGIHCWCCLFRKPIKLRQVVKGDGADADLTTCATLVKKKNRSKEQRYVIHAAVFVQCP